MTLTEQERFDLLDDLYNAQETLAEAVTLLARCAEADPDNGRWARGYIVNNLRVHVSDEAAAGFGGRDATIDEWLRLLEDAEDGE